MKIQSLVSDCFLNAILQLPRDTPRDTSRDILTGDVVMTFRAREVIHELTSLVYRCYPWSTYHFPPWIRPDVPNPDGLTVFNQDIYRINSADGTITAGDQVQSYIRLQVS